MIAKRRSSVFSQQPCLEMRRKVPERPRDPREVQGVDISMVLRFNLPSSPPATEFHGSPLEEGDSFFFLEEGA